MSTTDQFNDFEVEGFNTDPTLVLELGLHECEALRTRLLKPAADGTLSLDDPLVNGVLTKLGTRFTPRRTSAASSRRWAWTSATCLTTRCTSWDGACPTRSRPIAAERLPGEATEPIAPDVTGCDRAVRVRTVHCL